MYDEEESHPRNPVNNEEGNIRDGEIWLNLNESRNDNHFSCVGKPLGFSIPVSV